MAKKKDSPWFKFKVNDWINGDITLESLSVQGAFINICAYYWSKSCAVNYFACCKKFKKGTIDALIKSDLIKRDGEDLSIEFLDEQWVERSELSQVKSEAGKKGMSNRYNREVTPVTDVLQQNLTIKKEKENKKEKEREITAPPSLSPEQNFTLIFPHGSEKFLKLWIEWVEYRKAIKKPYHTDSQQKFELQNLGKYPEQTASEMIRVAIKNGWKNLRPLDETAPNSGAKSNVATGYRIGQKYQGGA